jgi:phosphate:Na+ symporter
MHISTVIIVLSLLSGVALFLYGMGVMGEGLQQVAGNKLEHILYRLTSTPLKGLLLGAGVTAVIQSSSATSVMVVGFVNSGLMKVRQAISIVMGAIIGTSITGWIICLSYIDGQEGLAKLLSTATISAVVAIAGICLRMFAKKDTLKSLGNIMLGFAVLMAGMQTMSSAVSPLSEDPAFISFLTTFSNPLLGIAFGAALTAVLQSASASVGILQALSITGGITFESGFSVLMGIGIGASVPVILSSFGTNTNGKRTAWAYLVCNVLSMLLGVVFFFGSNLFVHYSFLKMVMNPFSLALLNTVYRAIAMGILLPFINPLEKLVMRLVPNKEEEDEDTDVFDVLEDRFLHYPAIALSQCQRVMDAMSQSVVKNWQRTINLRKDYSERAFSRIQEKERKIDKYEDKLDNYLMQLTTQNLDAEQSVEVSKFLHCIPDFERIGDHSYEMAKVFKDFAEKKIQLSPEAESELQVSLDAVSEILEITVHAFQDGDQDSVKRVEPLREYISLLCSNLKNRHVRRLQAGECSLGQGVGFDEILNDLERIADHCSNVAIYMAESSQSNLYSHAFVYRYRHDRSEEYQNYMREYGLKYKI